MTADLRQGDAAEVLASLPAASIHCAVTSPPYWGGVRRYAGLDDTQLGLERTPDEYVARLVAVFAAVRRVLRELVNDVQWQGRPSAHSDERYCLVCFWRKPSMENSFTRDHLPTCPFHTALAQAPA